MKPPHVPEPPAPVLSDEQLSALRRAVPSGNRTGEALRRYLRPRAHHPHVREGALWIECAELSGKPGYDSSRPHGSDQSLRGRAVLTGDKPGGRVSGCRRPAPTPTPTPTSTSPRLAGKKTGSSPPVAATARSCPELRRHDEYDV